MSISTLVETTEISHKHKRKREQKSEDDHHHEQNKQMKIQQPYQPYLQQQQQKCWFHFFKNENNVNKMTLNDYWDSRSSFLITEHKNLFASLLYEIRVNSEFAQLMMGSPKNELQFLNCLELLYHDAISGKSMKQTEMPIMDSKLKEWIHTCLILVNIDHNHIKFHSSDIIIQERLRHNMQSAYQQCLNDETELPLDLQHLVVQFAVDLHYQPPLYSPSRHDR